MSVSVRERVELDRECLKSGNKTVQWTLQLNSVRVNQLFWGLRKTNGGPMATMTSNLPR